MKKALNLIMAAGMLCACAGPVSLENGGEFVLDSWTLNQEGSLQHYDVEVPSTVAGVLFDQGLLGEDLFEGLNYYQADKSIFIIL